MAIKNAGYFFLQQYQLHWIWTENIIPFCELKVRGMGHFHFEYFDADGGDMGSETPVHAVKSGATFRTLKLLTATVGNNQI